MSKIDFPFYFWEKYRKSLWTKGCCQLGDIYAVVTEIITEYMRAYMVTIISKLFLYFKETFADI